jgi:hypothetical protein
MLLFLDPGSGIRDPGSGMGKNQDLGSGINIPDPQHCLFLSLLVLFFCGEDTRPEDDTDEKEI